MARLTDAEIARIKSETDLAAVVRSRGVALSPQGGDLVGLCPFHDDKTPSLHVTTAKGLWRCVSCLATGNVIQFVQRFDGVSFRHAADLLASGAAFKAPPTCAPVKKSTVPKLPNPLAAVAAQPFDDYAADQEALRRVVDYYAERLAQNPAALAYLEKRGLADAELLKAFLIGFCDRTLGLRLPHKNRKEGAELRGRLARLGVMRDTGHEHFRGQITVPVVSLGGEIGTIYGRAAGKVDKEQRHRFLPGPQNGVFNPAAFAADVLREAGGALILTEGILDALTWWKHGYKAVTACYSARQPSQEVLGAIIAARVKTVFLSFDPDSAGDGAAEATAGLLLSRGVEVRRIRFPAGHDANSYALAVSPPRQALAVLLNAAEWLGKGRAMPAAAAQKSEVSADAAPSPSSAALSAPAPSSLAAKAAKAADVGADAKEAENAGETPREAAREETVSPVAPSSGSPTSTTTPTATNPAAPSLVQRGEHWFLDLDNPPREWRVGGLEKATGDALKVALRLRVGERFHLDALDLARDGERRRFVERAAEETGLHPDLLRRDVARLLLACEQAQAELAKPAAPAASAVPSMSAAERAAALDLLRAPDLLARILRDFEACGVVGEETNKLVGYLAAVSRKLAKPLAVIVQSTSAAGKSALMEAVLAFVPPEERVKYSALNRLAHDVLGRCLDEMPPQTRRLLAHVEAFVKARADEAKCEREGVRFTRRDLRAFCGWGDTQLKVHLGRLVELEYILAHRAEHGTGHVYELVYDGGGKDGKRHLPGLLDVEKLRRRGGNDAAQNGGGTLPHGYDAERSGQNGERSGSGRPPVGGRSGAGRGEENPPPSSENGVSDDQLPEKPRPEDADDEDAAA